MQLKHLVSIILPIMFIFIALETQIFAPTEKLNAFAQIKYAARYAVISSDSVKQTLLSKYIPARLVKSQIDFFYFVLHARALMGYIIKLYSVIHVERLKWFETLPYLHSVCYQLWKFPAWSKTLCQESLAVHFGQSSLNTIILFELCEALF